MSEWDFGEETTGGSGKEKSFQSGSWDVLLTIAVFLSVTAVSFLVAWLTRNVQSRPFWMLGLCFAAPVAALMLSVFLKEKASASMTPNTSRKAQLILVLCSILTAAVVGCFCQVTNEKADIVEEVKTEGWSNILIILDKSGSMVLNERNWDEMATEAVIDLTEMMDDHSEAGLLIDVNWEYSDLESRTSVIMPLTPEHRQELTDLAKYEAKPGYVADFGRALNAAADMVEKHGGEPGTISILMISDGTDEYSPDRASQRFNSLGVKVNYLYVTDKPAGGLPALAEMTGGSSIYVKEREDLLDQMREIVRTENVTIVYYDALRDIDQSVPAAVVTGVLLLLLGVLLGFSLMVMLSVQGQKRFQVILSPLMAVCAFLLLMFGGRMFPDAENWSWIREGIAFSLLGIVIMRKNRSDGKPEKKTAGKASPKPAQTSQPAADADQW